jgi:HEPN domain-containing protein
MDEPKRVLIRSWLRKASDDLALARFVAHQDRPFLDAALYHCQQAAEKALKGFLVFRDQHAAKTHNLVVLLEKAAETGPGFLMWTGAAERLTPYATDYRYPGPIEDPDPEQVDEALDDAASIYNQALTYLPSEVHPEITSTDAG